VEMPRVGARLRRGLGRRGRNQKAAYPVDVDLGGRLSMNAFVRIQRKGCAAEKGRSYLHLWGSGTEGPKAVRCSDIGTVERQKPPSVAYAFET